METLLPKGTASRCFSQERRWSSREKPWYESLVAHPQSSWRWVYPPAPHRDHSGCQASMSAGHIRRRSDAYPSYENTLSPSKEFLLSCYSPSKAQNQNQNGLYIAGGLRVREVNNLPRPPRRAHAGMGLAAVPYASLPIRMVMLLPAGTAPPWKWLDPGDRSGWSLSLPKASGIVNPKESGWVYGSIMVEQETLRILKGATDLEYNSFPIFPPKGLLLWAETSWKKQYLYPLC